ncbi:hypothetical protein [Massilia sp. BKSP1R2A-1]|uniref:hypothetical protein n=1 Tax=Massilia sp. BKSP1R2A-1 TaxID=3422595 RepID=UPI003D358BA5
MNVLQLAGAAMLVLFAAAWLVLAARSAMAKAALHGVLLGGAVSAYVGLACWLIARGAV